MSVQACFTPPKNCSAPVLEEIERAKSEILIAVYAFTRDDLAQALLRARARGVKVYVVLDRQFDSQNRNSKGSFLQRNGIAVKRISGLDSGAEPGLMHQKFAVIDGRVLFTGSYNWTIAAEKFNHENLLHFRDAAPLAEEYRREFFRLWEKSR